MIYETVVGLEVHVELATESKLFCACPSAFGCAENENCCEVCLGLPGSLPTVNRKAVEYAIRTGLALQCDISEYLAFDRKTTFILTCRRLTRSLSFTIRFAGMDF